MNTGYNSIKTGLEEAINFADRKVQTTVIHKFEPVDVKNIRADVGMSQREFAAAFGISVNTLRHWERGDRRPDGPALVLLNVLSRELETVLRVLSARASLHTSNA